MSNMAVVLIFAALCFLLYLFIGYNNSKKAIIKRAQKEGRHRIVEIDGEIYHAIKKTEKMLISKSGKGKCLLVATGRERDPHRVDGKTEMMPRWIKIRSITKNGLSDKERWVKNEGWTYHGEENIEYHLPFKSNNS